MANLDKISNSGNSVVDQTKAAIRIIRGQGFILAADVARIYGVTTKRVNERTKRHPGKFPPDFMFQLTKAEFDELRSQSASSKVGRGGTQYLPYAFTEQGVAMLSSVLNSKRSVQVNIEIMRTFVRIRKLLLSNKDLAERLNKLEKKYDDQFKVVFNAIRQLMAPETKPKQKIGF